MLLVQGLHFQVLCHRQALSSFSAGHILIHASSCCFPVTKSCPTLCDPMDCSTPGFAILYYLLEFAQFTSFESVMLSNHLILCRLLLLVSIFPSVRVFSNESVLCIKQPKYWNFSFSVSPSNEQSGLISFRIDWFDLLAVQGTLESLLQHHNMKASILWCSVFFMVQLSHLYLTTGKTIALTIRTFASKVISLLFDMLSRFIIAFLPRSKTILHISSSKASPWQSQASLSLDCYSQDVLLQ